MVFDASLSGFSRPGTEWWSLICSLVPVHCELGLEGRKLCQSTEGLASAISNTTSFTKFSCSQLTLPGQIQGDGK